MRVSIPDNQVFIDLEETAAPTLKIDVFSKIPPSLLQKCPLISLAPDQGDIFSSSQAQICDPLHNL